MLEQEIASIIKFTLDYSGNPAPYYYDVPQSFCVPAAFFPIPEIIMRGETFNCYAMDYFWYIKYFHHTSERAYELALQAIIALKSFRNLVPIIGKDGEATGKLLRISDPEIKTLDSGAVQITINWSSIRPYNSQVSSKMAEFEVSGWKSPEMYTQKTISAALENALKIYLKN